MPEAVTQGTTKSYNILPIFNNHKAYTIMAARIIYTGMQAKLICNRILDEGYNEETGKYDLPVLEYHNTLDATGYWKEEGVWVAFDNKTGDCWVEEFRSEAKARRWCDYE